MSVSKIDRLRALRHQTERVAQRIAQMQQTNTRWMWARVLSFLAAIGVSAVALFAVGAWLFWICLIGLGATFIGIVWGHRRLEQSLQRHQIWRDLKLAQIARMRLDWEAIPPAFERDPRYAHPFEGDIDLVGERSVHRLLDVTTTSGGSRLLRQWLSVTDPILADVEQRQALVRELAPLALLRTRLTLHGTLVDIDTQASTAEPGHAGGAPPHKLDADQLGAWFAGGRSLAPLRRWLFVLGSLAALNALLFLLYWLEIAPLLWPYTLAIYGMLTIYVTSSVVNAESKGDLFREAAALQGVLGRVAAVFRELESFSYRQQPHLKQLCQPFLDPRERPSHYIGQLARITNATGLRGNPLIWFALNLVLPWDIYFAYQLARCKASIGRHIDEWLTIWYELEALSSLANLIYLNPHYAFPAVRQLAADDHQARPILAAEGLAHPLLPDVDVAQPTVRNDFTVDELGWIAILTGSNMAGKSTFLKALGVNLALAYAGGPVDARRLDVGLFRLFTCIKVSDSVTDGISYFYAEVQRLQRLLAELREPHALPLFFCIDEIFRGTNNRERLIGSRAYIQSLTGENGSGLISTHDLELVQLADATPLIANYHFRDDVHGERMTFDYILRPGPCPTTNALRIMAAAGLPVDAQMAAEL
jgi:hypothetical protein